MVLVTFDQWRSALGIEHLFVNSVSGLHASFIVIIANNDAYPAELDDRTD